MAMVDFSNAHIEPSGTQNVTADTTLNLNVSGLYDSSGNRINSNSSTRSELVNQQKQLMYNYQGEFTDSGTELYIYQNVSTRCWRISNISFSNGDTYVFQINATLTCN